MLSATVLVATLPFAASHGKIMHPKQWSSGDQMYENFTFIPGEPTIDTYNPLKTIRECPKGTNPDKLDKTGNALGCYLSNGLEPGEGVDVTFKHPWRAPGTAFITSPCGVHGGNPKGCPHGNPGSGGCAAGGSGHGKDGRAELTASTAVAATWKAGSVQSISWNYVANHNGGYSYRLCKRPSKGMDLTEECFNQGHLNFAGNTHIIRYNNGKTIEIPAMQTTDYTFPKGSMWRRNPIPCCTWLSAGPSTGCAWPSKPQFDPPINVATGKSTGIMGYAPFRDWNMEDQVQVPNLPAGQYILSWRWDTEEFAQVWTSCSLIEITSSGPTPPAPTPPAPTPPAPTPPAPTPPAPTPPSPCVDKDHSCPTLDCGFCGKDLMGCLSSGCPEDVYDHESTGCQGGQCMYHCKCKAPTVV